jgi:hypothetical protein
MSEDLVPTGKRPNYDSAKVKKILNDHIHDMVNEAKASTRGRVGFKQNARGDVIGEWHMKSNFPDWYRKVKPKNIKDLADAATKAKGAIYNRLKDQAIERLNHGYINDHGHDGPDKDFLVASKQMYNNKGVIFRFIGGRIVPLRVGQANIKAKLKGGGYTPF